MIISASYRTDIPAFYGEWFMNRLRAGYCKVINPYGGQIHRISLLPGDVDGFVFWTKNLGPFLPHLRTIREQGYPFVVHYTVTGYPHALEPSVVDAGRAVQHIRRVAETFGPRTVVWRYDPVLVTSLTPPDFHRRNFERLSRALEGAVDEVVISFAQIYRKTRRNLDRVARQLGVAWEDPPDEEKRELARDLAEMARAAGMALSVCSQNVYLVPGAEPARCVDARRLSDVAGRPVTARTQGNRPDCGCHESRDIGQYDTCPHGCVYCYAVQNVALARFRYRRHDPRSEFLFPPL
ncbi:MAG TPA: DUF1848 domain-containing protein [Symbiobacteriaceae bacterium]